MKEKEFLLMYTSPMTPLKYFGRTLSILVVLALWSSAMSSLFHTSLLVGLYLTLGSVVLVAVLVCVIVFFIWCWDD